MKILRIGGRNLASLAGDFSVDFEAAPLSTSGLFAISGPTGAGKSTLLDALCLALYGATPRLKTARAGALVPDAGGDPVAAQDPRSLLRRGTGEAYAEVDFVGNDGARYRAQWSVRRAFKRATGALQPASMSLLRLPELTAIGGKRTETADEIEKRIGLTFDQFTRAVLLAQNEFAAFLKTDENDRGELLETLTGSTIYSAISKRAFERYKYEQDALRQLTTRLADQAPLAADALAALQTDSARADAVLAALDARQQQFEHLQRWRQTEAALSASVAGAEAALADASAGVDGAAPRRQQQALLAAVDDARPLHADLLRLRQQQDALAQAVQTARNAQDVAQAREQQAGVAAEQAGLALAQAERALAAAAPQLDAAKGLDAAIAALAPAHAQAQAAHAHSVQDAARAASETRTVATALATARAEFADAASWLQRHAALAPLAAQWPRWDSLLTQAARGQAHAGTLAAALQAARQHAEAARDAAVTAHDTMLQAATQLQQAEAARQQAAAALAQFDSATLRGRRIGLAQEKELLEQARTLWRRLLEQDRRGAAVSAQLAEARSQSEAASAIVASSGSAGAPLTAALQQAEMALRGAELACADKVEDLREQLVDEAPCPVCGATAHPYAGASPALHAVLASLREQVRTCRVAVNDNLERQAGARARMAAADTQAAALTAQAAALEDEIGQLRVQWQAMPLALALEDEGRALGEQGVTVHASQPSEPSPDHRDGVLRACDTRLRTLDAQLLKIDTSEEQARLALAARDAAQAAFERAGLAHAGAADRAGAARLAESNAASALAALGDKAASADADLQAVLTDLHGAFNDAAADATHGEADLFADAPAASILAILGGDGDSDGGWRLRWQSDPAAFQRECAGHAADYNAHAVAQPERQAHLAALGARHAASVLASTQAAALAVKAEAEHARHASDIGARQRQRAALFDGDAVDAVEARLQAGVSQARGALAASQIDAHAARVESARAADQLLQLQQRLIELAAQQQVAAQALAAWLEHFPRRHPAIAAAPSTDTLDALLAIPASVRHAEQQALHAIDAAAAAAATVLAERRAQLERHRELPPPGYSADAVATLAADLAQLATERTTAGEAAAGLRARIAEDALRRRHAETALAGIERQQVTERRWGRLSELIGSADGKKFRNYAQQFTLDVLLGYANAHLVHLAKRYRLERVGGASGPSLGLMVRDQDMGGEARGVNSLSGGESFLVSLALALGLASLSSNRVKVESLFIDEGFGSLDSETLRVAMDALDGLQAMGRKVGVISHVQEMTERIATRVVVAPAGAGSSSVTVE